MTQTLEARLIAKLDRSGGPDACWTFTGAKDSRGYGRISDSRFRGSAAFAHRIAYGLWVGPIPEDMMVLHSCDFPSCCNPAHLRVGTHAQNMEDIMGRGRQVKGTTNGHAKINDATVRLIREYAQTGVPQKDIASEFGIGVPAVSMIVSRKRWAHVD